MQTADGRKEGAGPSHQLGGRGEEAVDKWFLHFELMRVRQGHPLAGEDK